MIAALVLARLRRRPGRLLLPGLGIAVAVAFACAVAGEATDAGDRAARTALAGAAPVRVSARAIPAAAGGPAGAVLARPWLGPVTRTVLFESLRLGGRLVRLAAIAPLARWSPGASTPACAAVCSLLATGGGPDRPLAFDGLRVVGRARLDSAVPLGFRPLAGGAYAGTEPAAALLLSGDVDGLASRPGLASVYRETTWLAPLAVGRLHSWDLAGIERTLERDQADLASAGLSLDAPFAALDAARAGAAAAPRRLLLAGGGAAAVLVAFVLLAAGGLRADLARERDRLRVAGATPAQQGLLVVLEATAVSGLGALLGAAAGVAVVAARAGGPGVLDHSLGGRVPDLAGGWALVTLVLCGALLVDVPALALDLLAVAAVGALALALMGGDALVVLVAPLCCLAAGLLVLRGAGLVLRGGERAARAGPGVPLRLALVNLARAPGAAAGAAAFLTVSVALGVFALAYGATLDRGAADQAASEVPLDVTVAAGPSFAGPLALAPLPRWQALAGGPVLALRRTAASFAGGAATATVPLLAIPAAGLRRLPGAPDGRRLVIAGPARTAGPALPPGTVGLRVRARAVGIGVGLRAAVRSRAGDVTTVALGVLGPSTRVLRARLPAGGAPAELSALVLDEPAGLAATIGHQNAENDAPATAARATVVVVSVEAVGRDGRALGRLAVSGWRARGAASRPRPRPPGLTVDYDAAGATGVLRPPQPGDAVALPILADAVTAGAAGRGGRLELTVDGAAVPARVVGTLRRFPTVGERFVVADETALEARLDAASPGAGRPNELWLEAPGLGRTRAALDADPRLAGLTVAYRVDVARRLRADAVFRGVARTLRLAALVAVLLAAVGLVTALAGTRDRALEADLSAQGMGPRALRLDLRLRMLATAALGLAGGLGAGVVLSRLAVGAVRGSPVGPPFSVPLLTVVPWTGLGLLGAGAAAGLALVCWAATRRVG